MLVSPVSSPTPTRVSTPGSKKFSVLFLPIGPSMSVNFGLEEKVIVITGAGGIGHATALEASSHGARIAVLDSDQQALESCVQAVEDAGGTAAGYLTDVRDEKSIDTALDSVSEALGPIYGVVPTAGLTRPAPADEMPFEQWRQVMEVNLTGTFLTARCAAQRMIPNGGGSIVFISSLDGLGGHGGRANYTASKWGVIGMAKSMAIDWGRQGIRVNTICPGFVDTPLLRAVYGDGSELFPRIPLGRIAQPEDQARAIVYLLSEYSTFVTGAVLSVDGGMSAGYLTDIQE